MPITQKGQITIPKPIRDVLNLSSDSRVLITNANNEVKISKAVDILDLAGSVKVPKGKNALKAREAMEKTYERF